MPLYEVRCTVCGERQEIFRSLADFNNLPNCCGQRTERVLCAPQVMPDIQPYQSMIDGQMITSRSKHRAHLKQHGCIEIGNEKIAPPKPIEAPAGLKDAIGRAVYQHLG